MSLSQTVKFSIADTLNAILPLNYYFKKSRNRYVFAYHRIVTTKKAHVLHMQKSMWISPETFRDDIAWMRDHGKIVDLETILDFTIHHDYPLFSITFDDGWQDNYSHAYPVLKQHSLPATIFLVTNAINTGNIFWVEDFLYKVAALNITNTISPAIKSINECAITNRLSDLKKTLTLQSCAETFIEAIKPLDIETRKIILADIYSRLGLDAAPIQGEILDWDQIRIMADSGITFGSHTHTHEILQYTTADATLNELITSKNIISDKLNKTINYFCYPNARYNDESVNLVKSAGYSHAFRIHNLKLTNNSNQYLVPRFIANEAVCKNKNYLMCKLLGMPRF